MSGRWFDRAVNLLRSTRQGGTPAGGVVDGGVEARTLTATPRGKRVLADDPHLQPPSDSSSSEESDSEETLVPKAHVRNMQKARALEEYLALKFRGEGHRDIGVAALAAKYGVHREWFARTRKKFLERGTLGRKERECRPYKLTPAVQARIEKIARERRWDFTYEEMVRLLKARYDITLAAETVRRGVVLGMDWRVFSERTKPTLTPRHMTARYDWARKHRDALWTDWVDIDEKWFYSFANKRKLKQPKSATRVYRNVVSRSNPTKVMFLVAVARPRPEHQFDGLIGMWRITEPKIAKRSSKNHSRGEVYQTDCTLDATKFRSLMLGKVYRAIRNKMHWAHEVTLQMDGALPHTGQGNPQVLAERGANPRHGGPVIRVCVQPAMSPDTNVLDLCLFPSLSAICSKKRYLGRESIARAAKRAFRDYPVETLTRAWDMKTRVLDSIRRAEGNNDFELPHRKK